MLAIILIIAFYLIHRITNGYVSLQERIMQIPQNYSGPENPSPTSDSQDKIGFVKCNEGFVLADPNRAKLSCQNGIWGSKNQNEDEKSGLSDTLPECREIFCKTNTIIQNARLLKQVHFKSYIFKTFIGPIHQYNINIFLLLLLIYFRQGLKSIMPVSNFHALLGINLCS